VKNVNGVETHRPESRDIINSLKSKIDILKKQLKERNKFSQIMNLFEIIEIENLRIINNNEC